MKMTKNNDAEEELKFISLWATFTSDFEDLAGNIQGLISDTVSFSTTISQEKKTDSDKLLSEIKILANNIRFTLSPFWQQIKDEIFDLKCLMKERETEIAKLRAICQHQKDTVENVRSDLKQMKEIICQQSSYTASLGFTLSGLLWKASKDPYTVQNIITGFRFTEFFNIVNDSVKSFFSTYMDQLPHSTSDEVQFIVSLIGVIANVAAVPDGREVITLTVEGQEMVCQLVKNISKVPDSCICIQRLMLMAIFNVSIHKRGVQLFQNNRSLLNLLKRNVFDFSNELKYISLKLLQSITHNIQERMVLITIVEEIPFQKLQEMEGKSSNEERNTITEIRKNLQSAVIRLQNLSYNTESIQLNGLE